MTPAIGLLTGLAPAALPYEIVERKGLGHPDTICDRLAEHLCLILCRTYLERFGTILHHNVDKALLVAGRARPAFGGGIIDEPMVVHLSGRATPGLGDVRLPLEELAVEETRAWMRSHLRALDVERQVRVIPHLRPTSPDLASLFSRAGATRPALANDTSFGVGFAPLDRLERVVLAAGRRLEASDLRDRHPFIGEDAKILGVRRGTAIELTVACALVGRHVRDLADYREKRARIAATVRTAATEAGAAEVAAIVNAADGETADSIYLTVTGLSAEGGDDGQVGRGNRANGLITPYRPMSLEAVAGKNPVSHVGKLYNLLANRIAAAVAGCPGVDEAYCWLVSRIGRPIDAPEVFDVQVRLREPCALGDVQDRIRDAAAAEFATIGALWREAVAGRLLVC